MKKETEKIEEVTPYRANIKIFGKNYKSEGFNVKETLDNLKIEGKAVGVCILSISHNDVKKDRVLSSLQVARLFSPSKLMREIAIKNVGLLFDNI
jgi:hypothetical protein